MGNFAAESNGPLSGFAPPGSLGVDLTNGDLYVAGSNNQWSPAGGLVGVGAILTAANSIAVTNRVHHVTGTTPIEFITLPAGSEPVAGQQVVLIPDAASGQSTVATGAAIANGIKLATTLVQNKALIMTFDGSQWYPSY